MYSPSLVSYLDTDPPRRNEEEQAEGQGGLPIVKCFWLYQIHPRPPNLPVEYTAPYPKSVTSGFHIP